MTLEAALPYANPSDLEYSAAEDRLFISYRYKGVISTYSLADKSLVKDAYDFSSAATAAEGIEIAGQRLFVLVPTGSTYDKSLVIVDSSTGAVRYSSKPIMDSNLMALSPDGSRLYLAPLGLSPSSVTCFTTAGDRLTQITAGGGASGSNGSSLFLSPDGASLAFLCGAGNNGLASSYCVADYSPADLAVKGAWNVGPYPAYGTFAADSAFFYALVRGSGSSGKLRVFGRGDFQLKRDLSIPFYDSYAVLEASADNSGLRLRRACRPRPARRSPGAASCHGPPGSPRGRRSRSRNAARNGEAGRGPGAPPRGRRCP